ncbi:MAG: hypothetical protein KOO60_02040 [Gemmatimonadales bacterium]|nr:hypothetical protein [Gemmatimonadales bacterium]
MKNSAVSAFLLSAFALCLLVPISPQTVLAMDADELIAKNIEATGGLKTIKSIQTMFIEGNIFAQGMEFPFTMTQKKPGKMKIEASLMGMSMIQCFADGKGWSINPMAGVTEAQTMEEMEAKSFALQADMEGPLVDYKKKGYSVKYVGEEDVEGTPAYRISLDTENGFVVDYYFDKEHYLVLMQETRMIINDSEMVTQTYMSDYQEIGGMKMPYAVESRMGGQVMSLIKFTKVALNQDIDDSIFSRPVDESIKK